MANKTLSLTISERVAAVSVLNTFKGGLDKLATILEDIKQLPITEEEWTKAERVITPTPNSKDPTSTQWTWSDEKGGDKEVTLQEATSEYLNATIKERSEKGEFTLTDKAFITLSTKLTT